jgi:hypothetical protein
MKRLLSFCLTVLLFFGWFQGSALAATVDTELYNRPVGISHTGDTQTTATIHNLKNGIEQTVTGQSVGPAYKPIGTFKCEKLQGNRRQWSLLIDSVAKPVNSSSPEIKLLKADINVTAGDVNILGLANSINAAFVGADCSTGICGLSLPKGITLPSDLSRTDWNFTLSPVSLGAIGQIALRPPETYFTLLAAHGAYLSSIGKFNLSTQEVIEDTPNLAVYSQGVLAMCPH